MRYLIFIFWVIYYYTIGQIVIEVRFRITKHKAERTWCEFIDHLTNSQSL